jgi:GntR family transcriptional regulator, galactonate operon transcriptional repressor
MNSEKRPVRVQRLHDQITRYIGLRILRGDINDLETELNTEGDLSRHLNVSRNILREAIKVLAAKGLVEVRPKVGIRIRPRGDWNVLDPDLLAWQCEAGADDRFISNLCEVRLAIEPLAAELAAKRADDREIATLQHWYREMETHVENRQLFVAADMEFHATIFAACHNDLLRQVNATIGGALRASQDIVKQIPGGSAASLPLHKEVADFITKHNGRAAKSAMERLVKKAARDLYQVLHLDTINESHPSIDETRSGATL